MPKLARNHHFVPQGYLAGFTDTGTREGRLYVLDLQTQKAFATRPRNVAAQRDFNRIDVEDQRPDALNKHLEISRIGQLLLSDGFEIKVACLKTMTSATCSISCAYLWFAIRDCANPSREQSSKAHVSSWTVSYPTGAFGNTT